jgi:flagellar M-ring protein FliF
MEFIGKLWRQTKQHMGGLTRSQRLAIALCVVIIAGSFIWLVQWAAQRALVPLPLSAMTPDEMTDVLSTLERMDYEHRVEGERIYVRPAQKTVILARLMESESLSGAVTIDFARLLEDDSPWLSESEKQWRRSVALSGELSRTISSMSGVRSARVFVDNSSRRGFAGRAVPPSATVSVWPQPSFQMSKKRIHMLASLVSGAVAGLEVGNIRVVDERAGRSYTASDPQDAMAADMLELRRSEERHFETKIRDRLSYIPGVLVSVFAELESELTQTQKTRLDKPVISKTRTETTTDTRGPAAGEPGTRPNVGATVASSAAVENSETESVEEEFMGERGREVTTSQNTRGVVRKLTASIGVPRSWLIQIYKELNHTEEEPADEVALQAVEEGEFSKIEEAVMRVINAEDRSVVAVASFPDLGLSIGGVLPGAEPSEAATAGAVGGVLRAYGPQLGLLVLAACSLLLMLMIVRRASRPPEGHGVAETGFEMFHAGEVPTVGGDAASAGSDPLVGHELNEEEYRRKQVAEQVTQLVDDHPEMAASLVQSWIHEEEQ